MDVKDFKVGDRVWLVSVGWDCATVTKLDQLTIKFDGSEKSLKVPLNHQQWLTHFIDYPMPNVGDTIKINDKHFVCAGMEFTVSQVQQGGWVKTTYGHLFHYDFFETGHKK